MLSINIAQYLFVKWHCNEGNIKIKGDNVFFYFFNTTLQRLKYTVFSILTYSIYKYKKKFKRRAMKKKMGK